MAYDHPAAAPAPHLDRVTEQEVGPAPAKPRGAMAAAWNALTVVIATVMGLAPHVLHHIGLLAGAAFAVGVGGNLVFGAVGLLLSLPMLRRLYRRFDTWKAPAFAVAVFAVMFSLSAFVIGPAISGPGTEPPAPTQRPAGVDHDAHHGG